ncbi:MAG: hypothetical protein Q7V57_05890 [Actinomycetota bacterium]|nr:hypothetical protein [Actinomycetota bacterium]
MQRVWPIVLAAGLAVSGCSRLAEMGANPPTTSSIAPWITDPDADRWIALEAVCGAANDAAVIIADGWLPLDEDATPERLAGFYRSHADQVEQLVAQLAATPAPEQVADQWAGALARLADYAGWARAAAGVVETEGLDADQTPHPGLEDFRRLMPYGACHDLLDVN